MVNGYLECEARAFLEFRFHKYGAFQLRQYHFADCQPETHAAMVELIGSGQLAEELEQFLDLFVFHADAGVLHFGY